MNIKFIRKEAEKAGISIQAYLKYEYRYRKSENNKSCNNCMFSVYGRNTILKDLKGMYCLQLGIELHVDAKIKLDHICNKYM